MSKQALTYDDGFQDGLAAAAMLVRAGASAEDIDLILPADSTGTNPQAYQDSLSEIRRILGTDALFSGVTP